MKTESVNVADVHIRWMIRRDMPAVMAIEAESFDPPWTEDDFIRLLRQRNVIGMIAEHGDEIVGWMVYELHKSRLHLNRLAVHSRHRRIGIGSKLIAKLTGKLSRERPDRIMIEVRETNIDGQFFLRDRGFKAISLLREFCDDTGEDAYLMQYRHDLYRDDDAKRAREVVDFIAESSL